MPVVRARVGSTCGVRELVCLVALALHEPTLALPTHTTPSTPLHPTRTLLQAVLTSINDSLRADYALRRSMLLQRLDVTVQSFLWSARAVGKEAEIMVRGMCVWRGEAAVVARPCRAWSLECGYFDAAASLQCPRRGHSSTLLR